MILLSVSEPNEGVQHVQESTSAFIDGADHGSGTLYITESLVSWRTNEGQGFCLLYPKISLHAVSRDLNVFPQECLFLMVDGKLDSEVRRGSESSEEESGYDEPTTEVRFIPTDKGALDAMFSAMSDCQALHPDEQDTDSDAEDFEANYYEGEEGVEELSEQGQRTLQHLENLLINGQGDGQPSTTDQQNGDTDERFEDADNMEH
ncbi:hypothetical protein FSP39_012179 [Pinctada imbricata]|uniref:Methylosome subunit pICln n=1 Tax=Pinctada imbricata TaxID=66713 RepID=A0AA89BYJ7_PINIB|nr:hypothetical protein FSP39_012179 [Pinctada imbricata]